MREVVLDTETTGLKPEHGHKIIEIGCVELVNKIRTGREFHTYFNPGREIDRGAYEVHGISTEFLSDKPSFDEESETLLECLGDSVLVMHNAAFDFRFINHELKMIGRSVISKERVVDTLAIARKKFPGAKANLDALCKRFKISIAKRGKHGALIDAQLLASVYAEMMGGRQTKFSLNAFSSNAKTGNLQTIQQNSNGSGAQKANKTLSRPALEPTEGELQSHQEFLEKIKNPIWSNG